MLYRDVYRKPIVFDEIKYEGNIPLRWGNLSAEEMVHRFWECIIAGTYPGHGECYLHPHDMLWWSKGGVLHGQSPARIAFLRDILATSPADGIEPIDKWQVPERGRQAGRVLPRLFRREVARDVEVSTAAAQARRSERAGRRDEVPRRRARHVEHDDHADRRAVHDPRSRRDATTSCFDEDDRTVDAAGPAVDGAADHARGE